MVNRLTLERGKWFCQEPPVRDQWNEAIASSKTTDRVVLEHDQNFPVIREGSKRSLPPVKDWRKILTLLIFIGVIASSQAIAFDSQSVSTAPLLSELGFTDESYSK